MKAAEIFKDSNKVGFAAVDCTVGKEACGFYNVTGYPTFRYFGNFSKINKIYSGGRMVRNNTIFMYKIILT